MKAKEKAINFLYKDWLDYKKYYKEKQDFNMKDHLKRIDRQTYQIIQFF